MTKKEEESWYESQLRQWHRDQRLLKRSREFLEKIGSTAPSSADKPPENTESESPYESWGRLGIIKKE